MGGKVKVDSMKKLVHVRINGEDAHIFSESVEGLKMAGFDVVELGFSNPDDTDGDTMFWAETYDDLSKHFLNNAKDNEKKSWFSTVKESTVELFSEPEIFSYMLGAFAMLMSIVGFISNYFFYGKLYERFHNKK